MGYLVSNPNEVDYNIAFIMVVLAISGPYIIQYSSTMNAYFVKQVYTEEKWREFGYFRTFYLTMMMSIFGLFWVVLTDVYMKIEAIIQLITLPFYHEKWFCDFSLRIRK